MESLTNKTIIL